MFKEEYKKTFQQVTASQETYERVMQMTNKKSRRLVGRTAVKVLLAAVLVLGLAITVSASETIQNWFVSFFADSNRNGLTDSQITYLEDNTQVIPAESSASQNSASSAKTQWLQFVEEDIVVKLDIRNSGLEGGEPEYTDYRLRSLLLSEKTAKAIYVYMGNPTPEELNQEQYTRTASLPEMTVVMKNGSEWKLNLISADSRTMTLSSEKAIDLENVNYILLPDGTKLVSQSERYHDYEVTLDSFLSDGQVAYVTMNVKLPEEIRSIGEGWVIEGLHYTDVRFYPAEQDKATVEQIMANSIGVKTMDDGDGDERTYQMVMELSSWDGSVTFNPGSKWKLHLGGLEAIWRNPENESYLYEEKYAGQDVMLDGEESQMVTRWEMVSYDTFDFLLDFSAIGQGQEYELVAEPVSLTGTRSATIDELMNDPQKADYGPVQGKLMSFKISPLSYYIEYQTDEPQFAGSFDPGSYYLVMKDGKELKLHPFQGRQHFSEPIVLEEADYILCPDGTKLMIP